jgi:hypothetical protein
MFFLKILWIFLWGIIKIIQYSPDRFHQAFGVLFSQHLYLPKPKTFNIKLSWHMGVAYIQMWKFCYLNICHQCKGMAIEWIDPLFQDPNFGTLIWDCVTVTLNLTIGTTGPDEMNFTKSLKNGFELNSA